MLNQLLLLPRSYKRILSLGVDVVGLPFAFWLAMSVRLDTVSHEYPPELVASLLVSFLITIYLFVRLGLYRAVIRFMSDQAVLAILVGVSVSALTLAASSFIFQAWLPRSVPFIYWCIALLLVGGSRMLMRSWLLQFNRREKEIVIIYGAGSAGVQLVTALMQAGDYRPIAFVDDDRLKHGTIIQGLRVYPPTSIARLIEKYDCHRLLMALGRTTHAQRALILRFLEPFPLIVQTVPEMEAVLSGRARIEEVRDIDIEDLLGRDAVCDGCLSGNRSITGKVVLVSGAGGSIGSELCRQILALGPARLILLDLSEYGLYQIHKDLMAQVKSALLKVDVVPLVGSVQKQHRMEIILRTFGVQTVFHAAAYKHVPLVEHNVIEGVRNNVFGTWYFAEAAIAAGVESFVLVSTDKAVRPTNVMGASKRLAELILQGLAQRQKNTCFSMVRFGNVLGSSGSVVPLFREQIRAGGPVTVTHPDIIRYFMTIPEAAMLVLQASNLAEGGDVFVLDMGEPVKIVDLARKMIHLMGCRVRDERNPSGDIEVVYTGLRPGEKLFEELLIGNNPEGTPHPRILKARERSMSWHELRVLLTQLDSACHEFDCSKVRQLLKDAPTDFQPADGLGDLVWNESGLIQENVVPLNTTAVKKVRELL
ncbi:MAG: polysaccharide biosynthesis protein [Hahellaceae bacterium]|nr:polysaccharide biosynthesis protein [Hahellaceae bacterium]